MYGIIFLFLAMLCQNPNHHVKKHQYQKPQVSTTLDDDSGGDSDDTGHVPPKPPVPPPIP